MTDSSPQQTSATSHVLGTAFGFGPSQILYVAAELGLADHFSAGPVSPQALASKLGAHADSLARLFRALTAIGVLTVAGDETFDLTASGELLRSDAPGSLRATVRFLVGPWSWRAWEHLIFSVRTGRAAFDEAWGMSNFDYWERHADVAKVHDDAMAGLSTAERARVLAAYDFSQHLTIVDVGGGTGALLASVLQKCPSAKGILADLPHVVAHAPQVLQQAGVANRCQTVGGDFFHNVPAGGSLYILQRVIHDWDDDRALIILRNCRDGMAKGAKLLIIDRVLPPHPVQDQLQAYILDMTMLAMTPGGRERTQKDFERLLNAAGFNLERIVCTGGLSDIVEAQRR